jgi:AcrR family transcriptional regulator
MDRPRPLPYAGGMGSSSEPSPGSSPERLPSGRHGLPRAYVARSQRERLREAMVRVSAAKGYAATTIAEVTEMAGVSSSTFYEHFEDKDACFFEAFDAVNDVLVAHVSAAYEAAAGEPWPERIAAALRALVELLATEADIARATMVEVTAAGDDARKRYGEALARFTPLLDEGREYSRRPSLPEDTARFAIGGATSLIFDEVRAGRGQELPRILPQLVFAVLMPYLGPQAAEEEMRRVTAG